LRFSHEIEPASLDHGGLAAEAVRAEEDRRAEDALERSDEATILLSAPVHPKAFQHLSSRAESGGLALLLDRQSRQKYRDQAVLPEGHADLGMTRDLKDEPPIPPLVQELILWQASDRQSTEYERP